MENVSEWRDLPQAILLLILKSFNAQFYHLLLRAVCPSWRSALPLNSTSSDSRRYCYNSLKIPYLKPENATDEQEFPLYGYIVETIFFHVSPLDKDPNSSSSITDSWIIQAEEVGPAKWALFNPLCGSKLMLTPEMVAVSMNLMDYRISELGRSYTLRWVYDYEVDPPIDVDSRTIRKLICSFNESNSLQLILALCINGMLAFYQPGSQDWSFSDVIWEHVYFRFFDIISYNGKFYALDLMLRLLRIDPSKWVDRDQPPVPDLLCANIEEGHPGNIDYNQNLCENYLVVSRGSLYLVLVRQLLPSCLAAEYAFNDDGINEAKWVEFTSIGGDQVLFAGGESSFACSSSLLQFDNKIRIFFRSFLGTSKYDGCTYDVFQNSHAHNDTPIESCDLNCKLLNRIFWPLPSWGLLDMDPDDMFADRLTTCPSLSNRKLGIFRAIMEAFV